MGGTFVMDSEDAVKASLLMKPKMVIPMHESRTDPEEFRRRMEETSETAVFVIRIGETLGLS
jgi:L-ascorbate metabolism protein UlaG (beta-lactamase superfamily)